MASVTTRDYRGWQVVNLETPQLRVDVAPGKGGDLTSVVHLATGVELLWQTRWGLLVVRRDDPVVEGLVALR